MHLEYGHRAAARSDADDRTMTQSATPASIQQLEQDVRSGGNPLAYIPYADALRTKGQLAQALEVCREGLKAGPSSVAGRILRARIHFDMGKLDLAETECESVLKQVPQSAGARKIIIRIALKQRRFSKALALLEDLRADMIDDDPELLSAMFEAQRGLSDRFLQKLSASGAFPGREAKPRPASIGEVIERIRSQSDVTGADVIESGETEGQWAEMLRTWEQLCGDDSRSPIRLALLESKTHTVFVRDLGPETGALVVTLRAGASLGPVKHLADQLRALQEAGEQSLQPTEVGPEDGGSVA